MEGAVLKAILHATRIVQPVGVHRGVSVQAGRCEWLRVLRVLQNLEKSKTAICNPLIIKLCFWKFLPKTEFCNTANNMDTSKCVSP